MDLFSAHTRLAPVPFVPELRVHTAGDLVALWEHAESAAKTEVAPPFWAVPWAGGQAVARYVLDHPDTVRGRRVLDLASGSGLVAMAAARVGAASVLANEIDPRAHDAIAANAAANGVRVDRHLGDILDESIDADVVLAGDVFYSKDMAARVLAFMRRARAAGAEVIAGDPGRTYLPRAALEFLAEYRMPVVPDLEDTDSKTVVVWRVG